MPLPFITTNATGRWVVFWGTDPTTQINIFLTQCLLWHLLLLKILHEILHVVQLWILRCSFCQECIQLICQFFNVLLKAELQVDSVASDVDLLQQLPFGLQHLVLLLQEPHLQWPEGQYMSPRLPFLPTGHTHQSQLWSSFRMQSSLRSFVLTSWLPDNARQSFRALCLCSWKVLQTPKVTSGMLHAENFFSYFTAHYFVCSYSQDSRPFPFSILVEFLAKVP